MADLLTHYAVGHVGGKFLRDARVRVLFYLGNFLPDLVFKGFYFITDSPSWYCEPSHSPLMLILLCYLLAHLFEERWRRRAFRALLIGSYLHIALDAFKSYLGQGVILWAFPFSMSRFEFGLYRPGETLWLMLPSLGVIVLTELVCGLLGGSSRKSGRKV